MEQKQLTFIYDLDETLCTKKKPDETYSDVKPIQPMIDQLNKFYDEGNIIIIQTARNMLTQHNDIGRVIQNVGEDTLRWLREHKVKYHSIQFGKPFGCIYIDDKACLNDIEEIERRVEAIQNGTEKQYLEDYKNKDKRIEDLEDDNAKLRMTIDLLMAQNNKLHVQLIKNSVNSIECQNEIDIIID